MASTSLLMSGYSSPNVIAGMVDKQLTDFNFIYPRRSNASSNVSNFRKLEKLSTNVLSYRVVVLVQHPTLAVHSATQLLSQ